MQLLAASSPAWTTCKAARARRSTSRPAGDRSNAPIFARPQHPQSSRDRRRVAPVAASASLADQQQAIARNVGASSLLIVAAGAASIHLQPWPIAGIPSLELAARCCLAPALALLALIFRVSTYRFVSVQDIDAAAGKAPQSDKAKVYCAVLQNTLEQLAVAAVAYANFALLAPARLLAVLPTCSLLFLLGRVSFFKGYENGAPARAPGYALTVMPTALLMLASAALAVARLFGVVVD